MSKEYQHIAKKRKIENTHAFLLELPDDALRQILLQTPAADHPNLRQTCQRICDVLDDPKFARERCESGNAEVTARLLTPWQLYKSDHELNEESLSTTDSYFVKNYNDIGFVKDSDFGVVKARAHILVDGKKAGEVSMTMLSRNKRYYNYHEIASEITEVMHFEEMYCLVSTFFDRRARPRIGSIKKALGDDKEMKPLLHIEKVKLDSNYRSTTYVASKAIQMLLKDSNLANQWSIAFYIPDAESQMTEKQKKRDKWRVFSKMNIPRNNEFLKKDMWQFFRVGFQQVKETVPTSDCYYMFAVPSFINTKIKPDIEAQAIPIIEKPKPLFPLSAEASKMLDLLKEFCFSRQLASPLWEYPRVQKTKKKLDESRKEGQLAITHIQTKLIVLNSQWKATNRNIRQTTPCYDVRNFLDKIKITKLEDMIHVMSTQPHKINKNLKIAAVCLEEVRFGVEQLEEYRRKLEDGIKHFTQETMLPSHQTLAELDSKVRIRLEHSVRMYGPEVIIESGAIHYCARNLIPSYIEMLMEFIPENRQQHAINAFDRYGNTPLMTAASRSYSIDTCKRLLQEGADKNIVSPLGFTALGKFREEQKRKLDFLYISGSTEKIHEALRVGQIMENLLMPISGPTALDQTFLDYESDYEQDEDGVIDASVHEE